MSQFKRAVLWAALIAIVLLVLLSIYGPFSVPSGPRHSSIPFHWRCIGSP